jgi:hypothetical protein
MAKGVLNKKYKVLVPGVTRGAIFNYRKKLLLG